MTDASLPPDKPPVEVGWLLVGPFAPQRLDATRQAANDMRAALEAAMPDFDWRTPVVEREDRARDGEAAPVRLLDIAETERDARRWDFVLAITETDLRTYTRPFAVAATAQLLAAAVLSTAHLEAGTDDAGMGDDGATIRRRLSSLALHVFGRLNDLDPVAAEKRETGRTMGVFETIDALDAERGFSAREIEELRRRLADVADVRVEEEGDGVPIGGVRFHLRSVAENRAALPQAIRRMRPWAFPLRLSRLTTAAGSALLILIVTAEAWEMAGSLSGTLIALSSLATLAITSLYLLKAQRLLSRGHAGAMREQRAVRNVGTVLAVVIGMTVTWCAIFAVVLGAGWLLFDDALLSRWAGGGTEAAPDWLRPKMAGFTAALAMMIGALGASFEPYGYFRHVTYVDDEL